MPIAVLVSAPDAPALDPALLDMLRAEWGGGDVRWLAPREAAEFPVERRPEIGADVAGLLDGRRIDVAFVPETGRRKKLLIADMDSTMIGQECIDELADEAGVGSRVAEITARAMNGELDFAGALRERVRLLEGLPADVIDHVLAHRITLAPGGKTLLATMKADGAHAALVSGGFVQFADEIARRLGFDEARANRLEIRGGRLTGRVHEPILGRDAKLHALEEVSARLGITPDDALAVGDGANDLAMIERAGLGVALHAKPHVAARAPVSIRYGDLTALLYLQGYHRDEFATPEAA